LQATRICRSRSKSATRCYTEVAEQNLNQRLICRRLHHPKQTTRNSEGTEDCEQLVSVDREANRPRDITGRCEWSSTAHEQAIRRLVGWLVQGRERRHCAWQTEWLLQQRVGGEGQRVFMLGKADGVWRLTAALQRTRGSRRHKAWSRKMLVERRVRGGSRRHCAWETIWFLRQCKGENKGSLLGKAYGFGG
jgi:hypothetical protein